MPAAAPGGVGLLSRSAESGASHQWPFVHFQDIISTLNRFWAEVLLLQPYDTEKGAGR